MEVLRRELNDEQRAIAQDLDKNILVIAGPGSGKTRLLVHRIGYQLRVSSASPFKALCLTFTTEAAKEMGERLTTIVPSQNHDRIWAGNFHQFGQYLLSSHGHLLGYSREFEVIDEIEAADLLEDVLRQIGIKKVNPQQLYYSVSAFRGRVRKPSLEEMAGNAGQFDKVLRLYAKVKKSSRVMDFDDLIELPLQLVRSNPHLRAYLCDIYKYVYVDELQDTSLLQLELLKALFSPDSSHIFGVADEDQVLYEWRDARMATIAEFERYFKAAHRFLVLNHRSPEPIVTVANTLIGNNPDRYDKELKSAVTSRRGAVNVHEAMTPDDEAEFVANRIAAEVSMGRRSQKDFAVLGRVNWVLNPFKAALDSRSVPFVHVGDPALANSPSARFIKTALRIALGHPNSERRLKGPIDSLNSLLGSTVLTADEVLSLISKLGKERPDVFIRRLLDESGITSAMENTEVESQLQVTQEVVAAAINTGMSELKDLMRLLVLEWNRLQSKVLNAQDKVKVMTIHQSKGLEFPLVFIPRVEERMLPYQRKDSITNVPEERRLLFVAITRAQSEVTLSYCNDCSPFLAEIAGCEICNI